MSWSIGQVAGETGLPRDTLRYYEKIGLLPGIARDAGGRRCYGRRDLGRLRFIQRARKMGFSLAEIGKLLELRDGEIPRKSQARGLATEKLAQVEDRLGELELLRTELKLLINLCQSSPDGRCPIVDGLEVDGVERETNR